MNRSVRVHLLPALVEPGALVGGTAVVIDVLRATTTIVTALASGASRVIPCGEIDEARRIAGGLPAGTVLLGGERGGVRIEGFDLGNSPTEYAPAVVAGKTIVLTTTNGTRALLQASAARRLAVAAFANLNAVIRWLADQTGAIHILCAGTDGHVTLEDVLCAGGIVRGLRSALPGLDLTDDSTALALNLSETQGAHYDAYLRLLRSSRGGRNLVELGFDADVVACSRWDEFNLVPELSRDPWQIQPARDSQPIIQRFVEPPA